MRWIDLHVHSTCSDGTLTPSQLVQLASQCGLSAFALTDHDNTEGLPEALNAAGQMGIELIPGIEFSTEYQGRDIHIVGLDFDWQHPEFQARVDFYRAERLRRNQKMIDKMAADGIDISFRQMKDTFGETVWTRAHFARYLAEHGYVAEMREAFQTFIGDDCKYFVPREKVSPMEVVKLIRRHSGIPVLAHPFQYKFSEAQLSELLQQLTEAGLLGMEVYYSTHSPAQTEYLRTLAEKWMLAPSGGSDFHGSNKPDILLGTGKGNLRIPYKIWEGLQQSRREIPPHRTRRHGYS